MYQVIRDTREKENQGWFFENMCIKKLYPGDYTLEGYEDKLVIERKGGISEFANNIVADRFQKEIEVMSKYKYKFLILEFDIYDVINFPRGSGIPERLWDKIKIRPNFILKKIAYYQVKYGINVLLVGSCGKEIVETIFREVINNEP